MAATTPPPVTSAIAPTAELVRTLREFAPLWSSRAGEGEQLRRLPDATAAELLGLGAHRLLQPSTFGGGERRLRDHLEVVAAASEGCVATGWCLAVWSVHNWMMGMLDPAGQTALWTQPNVAITASIVPRTRFVANENGVYISGRFPFGSGADHADWFGVGGTIAIDNQPESIIAVVPRSAVQIDHESWRVSGLRGTGSKDFIIDPEVQVPWQRVLRVNETEKRRSGGQRASTNPLYRSPFRAVAALVLAPPALGAARGALARFVARLDGHGMPLAGRASQRSDPAARLRIAESAADTDAAALVLGFAADECDRLGRVATPEPLTEARVLRDTAYGVRLCARAVDRLYEAAGGSALSETEPLQRLWRDVMAARSHAILTWDTAANRYANALLDEAIA